MMDREDLRTGDCMGKPTRDDKRRRRERRVADRARRFEEHARLVVERQGDPNFPTRTVHPDGRTTISLPPEVVEELRSQQDQFREKFGRDPGPEDPVFFDPEADEPRAMQDGFWDEAMQDFADRTGDPMLRAPALASRDVGYMVTEVNMHLFSAHEVEAFEDAVARHLDGSGQH
jgi:hypothetical protein